MIRSREDFRDFLKADRSANLMEGVNWLRYLIKLFLGSEKAHVWRYIKTLRCCEYHMNNSGVWHRILYGLYRCKLHRLGFSYGFRVPPNVCGKGLMLYHLAPGGCLVNAERVGENCHLQTGVVLGAAEGKNKGNPTIGDNVSFGPGAVVLGKVTVGDNVFVAANAVVITDVPPNCLAAGIPAKPVKFFGNK